MNVCLYVYMHIRNSKQTICLYHAQTASNGWVAIIASVSFGGITVSRLPAGVLQCVAVCCSLLQCAAVCCSFVAIIVSRLPAGVCVCVCVCV